MRFGCWWFWVFLCRPNGKSVLYVTSLQKRAIGFLQIKRMKWDNGDDYVLHVIVHCVPAKTLRRALCKTAIAFQITHKPISYSPIPLLIICPVLTLFNLPLICPDYILHRNGRLCFVEKKPMVINCESEYISGQGYMIHLTFLDCHIPTSSSSSWGFRLIIDFLVRY